jgi:hypothetical protein
VQVTGSSSVYVRVGDEGGKAAFQPLLNFEWVPSMLSPST